MIFPYPAGETGASSRDSSWNRRPVPADYNILPNSKQDGEWPERAPCTIKTEKGQDPEPPGLTLPHALY